MSLVHRSVQSDFLAFFTCRVGPRALFKRSVPWLAKVHVVFLSSVSKIRA